MLLPASTWSPRPADVLQKAAGSHALEGLVIGPPATWGRGKASLSPPLQLSRFLRHHHPRRGSGSLTSTNMWESALRFCISPYSQQLGRDTDPCTMPGWHHPETLQRKDAKLLNHQCHLLLQVFFLWHPHQSNKRAHCWSVVSGGTISATLEAMHENRLFLVQDREMLHVHILLWFLSTLETIYTVLKEASSLLSTGMSHRQNMLPTVTFMASMVIPHCFHKM